MNRILIIIGLTVYATFTPYPAQAYLVPLIGAAGPIVTILLGVFAVLMAAVYMVFYGMFRAVKRFIHKQRNGSDNTTPTKE